MQDAVGPVLRMCDEIDQVVQAIREDNPGRPIEVVDSGAYTRVRSSRFLRVTRATLQRNLGEGSEMRQLEAMMSAFAGRIATGTDEVTWSLTAAPDTSAGDRGEEDAHE